jgi:hypothetical protein
MKLKVAVFGVVLAFTVNAVAFNQGSVSRRHTRDPQLPLPKFPGLPKDPTYPTIPKIPAPGLPNPKGEPGVPFPMSITLPFPWAYIEGLWRVDANGANVIFSFSVQTDTNGRQYLHVVQINENSGAIVAVGTGISVENDKLVRAAMTSKIDNSNYMLFIGSYKNTGEYDLGPAKSVTVLTVRPFTSLMGDHDVQVVVEKVSNTPYGSSSLCPTN